MQGKDAAPADQYSAPSTPSSSLSFNSFSPASPFSDSDAILRSAVEGRIPGRKQGSGTGLRRKADEDLSQNANTKRVRERILNMNEHEREIHAAKASDAIATYLPSRCGVLPPSTAAKFSPGSRDWHPISYAIAS